MPSESVDLVIDDGPYLVNYKSRFGNTHYPNDNPNNANWLHPCYSEIYRILKNNSFFICFYGYYQTDKFIQAWRKAGFGLQGHLVWVKEHHSKSKYVKFFHDVAYLLVKGNPPFPDSPLPDVFIRKSEGNEFHPAQKPLNAVIPLINKFSKEGEIVFDPHTGSGSIPLAAKQLGRNFIGVELLKKHVDTAKKRLNVY